MNENSVTRREMLKATAAIGMAAIAGTAAEVSAQAAPATKPSSPRIGVGDAATLWVCVALMLALVMLAWKIASVL